MRQAIGLWHFPDPLVALLEEQASGLSLDFYILDTQPSLTDSAPCYAALCFQEKSVVVLNYVTQTETGFPLPLRWQNLCDVLPAPQRYVPVGTFLFDQERKCLVSRIFPGKTTVLREKEAELLGCLLKHPTHPLKKEEILEQIWGYHPDTETHTLETHIYQLRQKIEENAQSPRVIVNDGEGYMLSKEAS